MTREIELAQCIQETWDAARRIGGKDYAMLILPWRDTVAHYARFWRCEPLAAVPRIVDRLECSGQRPDEFTAMWLTAAAMELLRERRIPLTAGRGPEGS